MRRLFLVCTAALILTGCQSPEEKVVARAQKWSAACGHPVDENGMVSVTEAESRALGEYIRRLEQSYQAERSQDIAKGAALLGLGSAMMASPSPVATPATDPLRHSGAKAVSTDARPIFLLGAGFNADAKPRAARLTASPTLLSATSLASAFLLLPR